MIEESKHSKLSLWLGLFLTISITVVKGGVPIWVSLSWVSLCCVALCIVLAFKPNLNSITVSHTERAMNTLVNPIYLFIGFQVWVVLQYALLSPDETASLNKAFIGFGMACLLIIWQNALRHPDALSKLFNLLVIFSVVQAVYGLWISLSGTNLLLWMPKLYYLDRPTGFFVNANHFAAYTVFAIVLCLSKTVATSPRRAQTHALIKFFNLLYNPSYIILCVLAIALIASKSIGALIALGVVLLMICANIIWRSKHRATALFGVGILVLIILLAISTMDYSLISSEVSGLSHTFSRRYELSEATLGMLKDTWLLGIGGGSFYSQFSPYRTLEIGNAYYNYAHNDLLQFWIEYGLMGVLILLLFVAYVLRVNVQVLQGSPTTMQATFSYASIYGTVAVAVHSLVDFPLHIPGFSVLYLVVISLNGLASTNNKKDVNAK